MTGLREHLDFELENKDLEYCIENSDIQAGDLIQKITPVLKSNLTRVESTLKSGVELDTPVQEELEKMKKI